MTMCTNFSLSIHERTINSAAILSARHSRVTVFAGSLSALAVMSLLSSLLGTILPSLIPQQYTTFAAALLFFVFGAKMVQEGIAMEAGEKGREKLQEEMREVQKEVEEAEEEADQHELGMRGGDSYSLRDLEGGASSSASQAMEMGGDGASLVVPGVSDSPAGSRPTSPNPTLRRKSRRNSLTDKFPSREEATKTFLDGAKNLCYLFFSPIFIQSFILTFLAEWGDRSQIATIALAAAHVCLIPFDLYHNPNPDAIH
jgi:putative Ca2+/H+ antiporter (TMEM165/GDT1 family)